MAEIKTVISTASESSVKFNDYYQFAWIKNMGDTTAYVSNKSGITAGGADVAEVGAGDAVMIVTETDTIYVKGATTLEIHAQNFAESPFLDVTIQGGEEPTLITKNITANGTYNASSDNADGYSSVTVDVVEQPWEPLEDGYSNFWFELTNDTLSPWLNFSAKNNDAVIDWGDGSGEVALDTLTPTHTYSKAGKYVVKVKGVTGIANQQGLQPFRGEYFSALKYVELNNEVTTIVNVAFRYCIGIKNIITDNALTDIGSSAYQFCTSLQSTAIFDGITALASGVYASCINLMNVVLPTRLTSIGMNCFNTCISLTSITIPSTVTEIGGTAFSSCYSLSEIHCQPTTPPTIGNNTFYSLPSNYIIYVPVGYGETYKAAWSSYADHIVEEGRSLSKAQLRRIAESAEREQPEQNER